jgi:hypothetical protein
MSDLSNDECRGCGYWVNCWGDLPFYATGLCLECRRKRKNRRFVVRKMREFVNRRYMRSKHYAEDSTDR